MARAIIRYSINGEAANVTGNDVRAALQDDAFDRVGTASFEARGSAHELVAALERALQLLQNPRGEGRLDHLWIYLDDAE